MKKFVAEVEKKVVVEADKKVVETSSTDFKAETEQLEKQVNHYKAVLSETVRLRTELFFLN